MFTNPPERHLHFLQPSCFPSHDNLEVLYLYFLRSEIIPFFFVVVVVFVRPFKEDQENDRGNAAD